MTNCFKRTTTLSWVTGAANNASITQFIIEQESSYEPNAFYNIQNVTNPKATSFTFNLTGWATLRFRMRAVNRFGPSRASVATTEVCETDVGRECIWLVSFTLQTLRRSMMFFLGKGVVICYIDSDIVE